MSAQVLDLSAAGVICAAGSTAPAACAAMRAGIAAFGELPYWDKNRLPVIGAAVRCLGFEGASVSRLVEMLALALQESIEGMPATALETVPLLVGIAEPGRPGGADAWGRDVVALVEKRLDVRFHRRLSGALPLGHTAAFEGLRLARQLLREHDVPGCLVCGVDSYLNASTLYWLDQHWRLKRENHTDGVIPGEAAASIYVQRQYPARTPHGIEAVGLGFALEEAGVLSERPLLALGLASAGREALAEASLGFHEVEFRLSDVTGESYGFRELALVEGRLAVVVRKPAQPLWHSADSIGDTGAASGLIQLAWASDAWAKGYAPGARAACFSSAVAAGRAVAMLRSRAA